MPKKNENPFALTWEEAHDSHQFETYTKACRLEEAAFLNIELALVQESEELLQQSMKRHKKAKKAKEEAAKIFVHAVLNGKLTVCKDPEEKDEDPRQMKMFVKAEFD